MDKIIAIPGYLNSEKTSFGASPSYLEFISVYGTPRILMPGEKFEKVDMLLLPGGADVNPSSYGSIPGFRTGNPDVHKQFFLDHNLKDYVDNNIPILGICLGMQQLAVYFGSILTQNLIYHDSTKDNHEMHKLTYMGGRADRYVSKKKKSIDVNSRHHQGVLIEDLSGELEPLFFGEEVVPMDLVEVFCHKEKPIFGIQYHPEDIRDEVSHNIIMELLQLH